MGNEIKRLEAALRALGYRLHRGEGEARANDSEWLEALLDAAAEEMENADV